LVGGRGFEPLTSCV